MTAPQCSEPEMAKLDRIAREYREPDPGRRVDQKLISLLVGRTLPWIAGPEVLEMGSGDDQWTRRLIERFGHAYLVDGSHTLIEAARKKHGARLTTYHSLFEKLNPGKQFDTVLSSLVLEHVADPEKVLATAAQWVKPNGHLIVIVPNALSLHRRLAVAMGLTRAADEPNQSWPSNRAPRRVADQAAAAGHDDRFLGRAARWPDEAGRRVAHGICMLPGL